VSRRTTSFPLSCTGRMAVACLTGVPPCGAEDWLGVPAGDLVAASRDTPEAPANISRHSRRGTPGPRAPHDLAPLRYLSSSRAHRIPGGKRAHCLWPPVPALSSTIGALTSRIRGSSRGVPKGSNMRFRRPSISDYNSANFHRSGPASRRSHTRPGGRSIYALPAADTIRRPSLDAAGVGTATSGAR